jgi:hypothetical protein
MWYNIRLLLLLLLVLVATLLMVCGRRFVWHVFLSKYKFLWELVGNTESRGGDHGPSGSETEEDHQLLHPG